MIAASTPTPAITPTTIPAIAPPLSPDFLFFDTAAVELIVESDDEVADVTIEVVVMNTVCCCWFAPVDTDAVTMRVV